MGGWDCGPRTRNRPGWWVPPRTRPGGGESESGSLCWSRNVLHRKPTTKSITQVLVHYLYVYTDHSRQYSDVHNDCKVVIKKIVCPSKRLSLSLPLFLFLSLLKIKLGTIINFHKNRIFRFFNMNCWSIFCFWLIRKVEKKNNFSLAS